MDVYRVPWGSDIRRTQDGLHLGLIEPVDQEFVDTLLHNRSYLHGGAQTGGHPVFEITEEALDDDKTLIAGAHVVVAFIDSLEQVILYSE